MRARERAPQNSNSLVALVVALIVVAATTNIVRTSRQVTTEDHPVRNHPQNDPSKE